MQRHSGMFQPGQSGNPSGRPKSDQTIRDLARTHTQEALETLVEIVRNPKTPSSAKVQACNSLLDRGWGKPVQYNENHETGNSSLIEFLDSLVVERERIDPLSA